MSEDGPDYRYSESTLNYRASRALEGDLVTYESYGAALVTEALVELLRSPHEISREVREQLADALDRGRGGYRSPEDKTRHVIRLMVEDLGPNAAVNNAAAVRFNYLEAAEEYQRLRESKVSADDAIIAAGGPRDLRFDSMRKHALPFQKKMSDAFNNPAHELHAVTKAVVDDLASIGMKRPDENHQQEDYYSIFRSHFVWAEAEKAAGFHKG